MSGWFAITRDSLSHPLFKREPVTEWEAWTRLIARAAHAATRHRVGGEVLDVERGSFFCTLRELQSEFMWRSDARVRKFLERLENERMIERKTNAGKTHVTICNYDEYQQGERKENAKRTQPGTQDERKTNALKNKGTNKQDSKESKPACLRDDVWAGFVAHRKSIRKPLTGRAIALLSKSLDAIAADGFDPNDALDLAIERGWATIKLEWAKRELGHDRNHTPGGNHRDAAATAETDIWLEVGRQEGGRHRSASADDEGGPRMAGWAHQDAVVPLFPAGDGPARDGGAGAGLDISSQPLPAVRY